MKAGESMRRNFAQILKDAKIDVKVEYQKLYGMLYDRSIQVSNTSWISAYDEFSTYFIAFHFRGTCLSLDEFNDLHGFHFEKDPTNFNIDHLISLCEYIENLLMAYQLEFWYDEVYQMCLLAILRLEHADRKKTFEALKSEIENKTP